MVSEQFNLSGNLSMSSANIAIRIRNPGRKYTIG
jgi:hypothetical protein